MNFNKRERESEDSKTRLNLNTTRINGDRSFFSLSPARCKFFFRRFSLSLRDHRLSAFTRVLASVSYLGGGEKFLGAHDEPSIIDRNATYFSFVATGGSYFRINASEKKKARRAFLLPPTPSSPLPSPPLQPGDVSNDRFPTADRLSRNV